MGNLTGYANEYKEALSYAEKVGRYGLSKMPPLIITCAITGGAQGAEVNPALPETPDAQAQSAYEAYCAGASMIHIHARDPQNLGYGAKTAEDFLLVNQKVRAKCPDVIINNTCAGNILIDLQRGVVGPQMLTCIDAKPEVSSVDLVSGEIKGYLKARKPPLSGRDQDIKISIPALMTSDACIKVLDMMTANGTKPEWECFDIGALKMLNEMIAKNKTTAPHWIQFLFGGTGVTPAIEYMQLATKLLPPESMMSIIAIGPCQTAFLTLGILMGHHVRVGMEDNYFYGPGELAKSNGQLVERIVRIARDLGREVATPAQAREMLGLGEPRKY